jgi:hypothetical protein
MVGTKQDAIKIPITSTCYRISEILMADIELTKLDISFIVPVDSIGYQSRDWQKSEKTTAKNKDY